MKSANLGPQFVGFSWVLLLKLGRGTLVSSLQRALLREQAGKRWVTCFLYRCYQIYQNGNGNILFPFLSMRSPGFVLPCIDWTQTGLGDLSIGFPLSELGSISNCAAFGSPIKSTSTAGFQRKIVWWTKGGHRTRWGMMLDTYTPVNQHKCAKTHRESRSCSHGFTMGDLMFTPVTGNDPIRANMIQSTQLQTSPSEVFQLACRKPWLRGVQNGVRSQAPALYKEITTTAISITAERSGHCVCASVHFADEPFQRGTGFKSAAKSKEWKSQERLHISNVLRWSRSPSHLGMAQLRITTINSSLLLSKSANRAAAPVEPRLSQGIQLVTASPYATSSSSFFDTFALFKGGH